MPTIVTSPVTSTVSDATGLGDGSAGAPAVAFLSDNTTGICKSAGATVGTSCGGALKLEVSATAINCHDVPLTNVGDITLKATGKALANTNAVTGIAAGQDITNVKTLVGIVAGQAISAVATVAGIAAGLAQSAVASIAGIAAGMDVTAVKTLVGIGAGVDVSAVKSVAGIAGGADVSALKTLAGIGAGVDVSAVKTLAGIAGGADVSALKTIAGIAAGVDVSAVKSLAFIAGKGAITNCSSIDAPGVVQRASTSFDLTAIQGKTSGVAFNVGSALPANARLVPGSIEAVVTAITGGSISAMHLSMQFDAEAAGSAFGSTDVTAGGTFAAAGTAAHLSVGGQQCKATLTATGDTLAHATAGALTISLQYTVIP